MGSSAEERLEQHVAVGLAWARWAVDRWAGFPIDCDPRPLVLVGPRVDVETGFRTGDAKLAYLSGRYEFRTDVPAEVQAALHRSAEETTPRSVAPLTITTATRSRAEFWTDRGRRDLPAWRLEAEDALGPIWVLDPDIDPAEWTPPDRPTDPEPAGHPAMTDPTAIADLAPDGRTLTLHFIGGSPAYDRYPEAKVVESRTAVALVPVRETIGTTSGWRTAEGHARAATGRLHRPLGQRVLVNLHGHAGEVRPVQLHDASLLH